jgi:hypothetical protein
VVKKEAPPHWTGQAVTENHGGALKSGIFGSNDTSDYDTVYMAYY